MSERVTVSRRIAASPEVIWAAVSDVTRMGEWSPECHTCGWIEGATGPEVGATFEGHNRNGDKEWTTQVKVVESVPGERFVFEPFFGDFTFSRWGYLIEGDGDGSIVTEFTENLIPEEMREVSSQISGVTDRDAHNRAGMEETLARLAAVIEG